MKYISKQEYIYHNLRRFPLFNQDMASAAAKNFNKYLQQLPVDEQQRWITAVILNKRIESWLRLTFTRSSRRRDLQRRHCRASRQIASTRRGRTESSRVEANITSSPDRAGSTVNLLHLGFYQPRAVTTLRHAHKNAPFSADGRMRGNGSHLHMYIYIHIYIYLCIHVCMYIRIFAELL